MAANRQAAAQSDSIKFVYKYDNDYRMVPANGIWGGFTPEGRSQGRIFL